MPSAFSSRWVAGAGACILLFLLLQYSEDKGSCQVVPAGRFHVLPPSEGPPAPAASPSYIPDPPEVTAAKISALKDLHGELSAIMKKHNNEMGHTGQVWEQTVGLYGLVRKKGRGVRTVCEIGFNVGHSAATIMQAIETVTEYWAFDIGGNGAVQEGMDFLQKRYPNAIFHLVLGFSTESVPRMAGLKKGFYCDLIHIDGRHDSGVPIADFNNMKAFMHRKSYVMFDDCGCMPGSNQPWCEEPTLVFEKLVAEGELLLDSYREVTSDAKGTCAGFPGNWSTVL